MALIGRRGLALNATEPFEVPIEIVRNFDEAVELEDDDASC